MATPLEDLDPKQLTFTEATAALRRQAWTLSGEDWAGPNSLDEWVAHKEFEHELPLMRQGDKRVWVLVDDAGTVYSAAETMHHHTVMCAAAGPDDADTQAREGGWVYSIWSVHTPLRFRRRGYASRLLAELQRLLAAKENPECRVSVINSEAGVRFAGPNRAQLETRHQSRCIY